MTESLLSYLNNEIKLSKPINDIATDFCSGYFFAEILSKTGNLNSNLTDYIKNPKNSLEISNNFYKLKEDLKNFGINLDNQKINSISSKEKNEAAKLIYKMKIQIERKKINFEKIMENIESHTIEDKKFFEYTMKNFHPIKKNEIFNKTKSSTNRSEYYNFRASSCNTKHLSSKNKDNKEKETSSLIPPPINLVKALKENKSALNIKNFEKIKNNNIITSKKKTLYKNSTMKNFYPRSKKIEELSDKNSNPIEHNIFQKKIINYPNNDNKFNSFSQLIDNNNTKDILIKYSDLDLNTFKMGLNIRQAIPRLKKQASFINNSDLIPLSDITNKLKKKLSEDKELLKNKSKKFLSENQKLEKFAKQNLDEDGKPILIDYDKTKSFYKMKEYAKMHKKNYPIRSKEYMKEFANNKNLFKNNNFQNSISTFYSTGFPKQKYGFEKNYDFFNPAEFFSEVESISIIDRQKKMEKKEKNKGKHMALLEIIIHQIIDIVEVCYQYQNENECELVEIPQFQSWLQNFIDDSAKSSNKYIRHLKNKNHIIDKNEISKLNEISQINENKYKIEKLKNDIIKSENCYTEFIDYINYRGYWKQKNNIDEKLLGDQIQIYELLGDEISNMIINGKMILQGLSPSTLLKMKNEEFELTAEEKENITIPNENKKNDLFGEIILLNFDNIPYNNFINKFNFEPSIDSNYFSYINKNILLKESEFVEAEKKEILKINNSINLNYIPIKICLFGYEFSGRKTQAELLCEKYPLLKFYSIKKIIKSYLQEYERLYVNSENNSNINKSKLSKKALNEFLLKEKERQEELNNFDQTKNIIEPLFLNKINDLSDEMKIFFLLKEIQKDFPQKKDTEIYEETQKRNSQKLNLEQEIAKLKEEAENKKTKLTNKQILNLQQMQNELENLNLQSYQGFILVDFPNNLEQLKKLEKYFSFYIQEIDKFPEKRDIFLSYFTSIIDKPYNNISYLSPEVIKFFGNTTNISSNNIIKNKKSIFNNYIYLETDEKNILNRAQNRMIDPVTEIIYHMEYNKPPPDDKKILERLQSIAAPSENEINEKYSNFIIENQKMLKFIRNFKNLKEISGNSEKSEINQQLEEIIINIVKKVEDRENEDIIGEIDEFEESDTIKYFKRLSEIKKKFNKDISENIIEKWGMLKEKYILGVKEFIYKLNKLKLGIKNHMDIIQSDFMDFLNTTSKKKKFINIFLKKYEMLFSKFSSIKNNNLVKEEMKKDIIELTESLWKIVQTKKSESINQLQLIISNTFVENQISIFWELISNLFLLETEYYINKLNLIRKFYYEFEIYHNNDVCPYIYSVSKKQIFKETENFEIYPKISKNNQNSNKKISISPKIEKIFKNCFKLLFYYDKKMKEIEIREISLNSNTSEKTGLPHVRASIKNRKLFRKESKRESSIISESKSIINQEIQEIEMKTCLQNEKIKFKMRLAFLKCFGEKFLQEIDNVSKLTFNNMDNWIIKSVEQQNKAMNNIINKIKIELSLKSKNIAKNFIFEELDIFNIYKKYDVKFKSNDIKNFNKIENKDKKFDADELYKIYLDIKNYEIQSKYITVNTLIDILFKKHIFDFYNKTKAFMNLFKDLSFRYFNNFIYKLIIKTPKGQNLIRTDFLFTLLLLINFPLPTNDQYNDIKNNIKNKNSFISKEKFLNINFWFQDYIDTYINLDIKKHLRDIEKNSSKKMLLKNGDKRNSIMTNISSENNNSSRINSGVERSIVAKDGRRLSKGNLNFRKRNSFSVKNNLINNLNNKSRKDKSLFFKEILFDVCKDYNDEINFDEFLEIISLKVIRKKEKNKSRTKMNRSKSKKSLNEASKKDDSKNSSKNNLEMDEIEFKKDATYFEVLFEN